MNKRKEAQRWLPQSVVKKTQKNHKLYSTLCFFSYIFEYSFPAPPLLLSTKQDVGKYSSENPVV